MNKFIAICALVILLFGSAGALAETGPVDTLDKAVSTEGNATVGMGKAPWQHQILWPIYEPELKEIIDFIIDEGNVAWDWSRIWSLYTATDGVIYGVVSILGGFNYLVVDPLDAGDPVFMLSWVSDGYDRWVDLVGMFDENLNVMQFYDTPEEMPSIYSSDYLKRLWHFYRTEVNPCWPEANSPWCEGNPMWFPDGEGSPAEAAAEANGPPDCER